MAQARLSVRKIKDLLRLHWVGGVSSCRQLGLSVGCGKTAVADCLRRTAAAGLTSWKAIAALDEEELGSGYIRALAAAERRREVCSGRNRIGRRYVKSSPAAIIR